MNINNLDGIIPNNVIAQINDVTDKYGINTELRLAHFLSQASHESKNFTRVKENLNYSGAVLYRVFKSHFKNQFEANQFQHQPQKIANRIYSNRMGNGDEKSGDGYKFFGRGYIQLTGRENYTAFSKTIDSNILNHPELVSDKYPLQSAAWFFNRAIKAADGGDSIEAVEAVTKIINGGEIGFQDRYNTFLKIHEALKK